MSSPAKTDRWTLIQEIFQSALERKPSDRSAYIASACGGDEELQREVESLVASDSDAGAVLQSLVAGDIRDLEQTTSPSETGLELGPYRLLREIDSGGMGIVYLAVRSDDQYFQIVAIKMLRKGLESPQLIRRFRAERQILATLNHPNIGAILDGGETKDGRPFIVMEYVEGQPITQACESHAITLRQRIELFRSVCAAVHYAHQKLIIHCDIKPSNVLVTPQAVVKLIDFGVSKPLAPEAIPGGVPKTETSHRLLTPDYASPEQLLGRELTTASDIYSLGVLLFELLTGSRPYTLQDLSPAAAERLVCSHEIRKPSSVSGLPARTRKEIAGDLDRIVLMAMDQEPSRRYSSAQHLEEDLVRFLEGKPVAARKATFSYRTKKFVLRHKTATTMTCTTVAMLAGFILLYSWQSHKTERRVAQYQTLADSTISELTEKLQQTPASVETQALLFHSALNYLEQLRRTTGNDPRLLLKLSKTYERVGDLEGSPSSANLGKVEVAIASYQKALTAAMEAHHARMPKDETTKAVIELHERLGNVEFFLGNIQNAHDHYQECLSFARSFVEEKPDDPVRRRVLAMSHARLGDLQLDNLETLEALKSYRAALQTFGNDQTGEQDHDLTLSRLYVRTAGVLNELGAESEAVANLRNSLAIAENLSRRAPKENDENLFSSYTYMSGPLIGTETLNVGDSKEAQIYARKALAIAEALAATDAKNVRSRYYTLSFAYEGMGNSLRLSQPVIAAGWYRKSISLTRELARLYPAGNQIQEYIADRDEDLAAVLITAKERPERLALLQEANGIWKEMVAKKPGKPQYRMSLMRSYCRLSDTELAANHLVQARQYSELSLPLLKEFKPDSPSLLVLREVGFCDESLGNLQRRIAMDRSLSPAERRAAEATSREWYRKSLDVWSEWNRRGAATPESELERRKVERLLG